VRPTTEPTITPSDRARILRELENVEGLFRDEGDERSAGLFDALATLLFTFVIGAIAAAGCVGAGVDAFLGIVVALGASVPIWKVLTSSRRRCADALSSKARQRLQQLVTDNPALLPPHSDRGEWSIDSIEPIRRKVRSLGSKESPGLDVVQPHRGWVVLSLGLVGIAVPLLAVIAWVMGNQDLKAIEEGRMDPKGEANTRTGKTIGQWVTLVYGGLIVLAFLMRQ
jgi:hypothetical protein